MEGGPISIDKIVLALREWQPLLEQQKADELVMLDVAAAEQEINLLGAGTADSFTEPVVEILQRLKQHDNSLLLKKVNELLQRLQPPAAAAQPVLEKPPTASEVAVRFSEELNELKRLLAIYNNKPNDKAFNNVLNYLINSEKPLNTKLKNEEKKLVAAAFKELFRETKFENLSHQRLILSYVNDRTINEKGGLPYFYDILLDKSEPYEEIVIKRLCQNKTGKDTAEDLRQHFFKMIGEIQVNEFTDLAWSKKDGKERAPNVYKISDELNKLSLLVVHDLLLASPQERLKVFEKYCHVLAHAINNNDVGLVNAIYSGMNAAEIKRLNLKSQVRNKRDINALMFIAEKIVSSDGSYKMQRKIEKQATQKKQAIVPSITTLLNDLTFAHDGNLDAKGNLKPAGKEQMDEIIETFSAKQALVRIATNTEQERAFFDRISSTAYVIDSRTGIRRSEEILPSRNKKPPKPSQMKSIEFYLIERLEKSSSSLNSNITALNLTFERINKRINDIETLIDENALTKDEFDKFSDLMIASEAIQGLTTSIKESEVSLDATEKFIKENPDTPDLAKLSAYCTELKNDIAAGWQIIEDAKVNQRKLKEAQAKATAHRKRVQPEIEVLSNNATTVVIPSQVTSGETEPEAIPEAIPEANPEQVASAVHPSVEPEVNSVEDEELPAEKILEILLKQYHIIVYESKSAQLSKARQEQAVAVVQEIDEQINHLINKVKADKSSNDPQVKAAAIRASEKMQKMVEKYQDLRSFLQTAKTTRKKNPIKRVVSKVKSFREKISTEMPTEKPKDLLGLINALREETHKRTREEYQQPIVSDVKSEPTPAGSKPEAIKPALVKPGAPRKPKRQVHFADEEPPSVKSNPTPHPVAFANDLPALESLKEKLVDNDPGVTNSARQQAMKQSVELLKNLPPTHKPKNFADIVQFAENNVTDWQNIHEVQRKKACEVVLAVIISPNASVDELKLQQDQLQARLRMLKSVEPMTQQIRKKIVLREAVVQHLNTLIIQIQKSATQQARPSAVMLSAGSSTESHSAVPPSSTQPVENKREAKKPTK